MPSSFDGFKPAQVGLVDMGDVTFYDGSPSYVPPTLETTLSDLARFEGQFSEMVLNVTWAQLQPTQGGQLDPNGVIAAAIAAVEAYNSANHTNLGIKLRVWGGFTAPDWAKNIDGPPITITGQSLGDRTVYTAQTIGRIWSADYIDAWNDLQSDLAQIYDSNPVIRGISNTAGATATDEPFVPLFPGAAVSSGSSQTVNQLLEMVGGGYSDAAERLTLRASIADYSDWSTTPLDFTFNRFVGIDSGEEVGDLTFTLAVLQQARNSSRLVQPGNHALHNPLGKNDLEFVYAQLGAAAALDPSTPLGGFQTGVPGSLTNPESINEVYRGRDLGLTPTFFVNWPNVVALGLAANAGNVELWDIPPRGQPVPGFTAAPPSLIQHLATLLASGTAPLTGPPATGPLDFIAPSLVTSRPGTVAFSGTDAVLLASAESHALYALTLTSTQGGTLSATDANGIVSGSASSSILTLAGTLDQVNTVLASLTDTLSAGTDQDIVQIEVLDSLGNSAVRKVGVQLSSAGSSSGPASGGPGAAEQPGNGILIVGGVQNTVAYPLGLEIGTGQPFSTLLAALAPSAYSTTSLTIGGSFEVGSGGSAHFTGSLSAPIVTVDVEGTISGDGILGGGPIVNSGTIEAATDPILGLQQLTLTEEPSGDGLLLVDPGATLILNKGAGPDQTVQFAPNSIAQFSNDPYSPSTLVLGTPQALPRTITGFSFADRLVLAGVTIRNLSYSSGSLIVAGTSGTTDDDIELTISLSGSLAGLSPSGIGTDTITFVTHWLSPASVEAPATLEGAVGQAVGVPDIVLLAPLPAPLPGSPSIDPTYTVTLSAPGVLSAVAFGSAQVTQHSSSAIESIEVAGTLGEVERTLQTLTYTATGVTGEHIEIVVGGVSSAAIDVYTGAPTKFDWDPAVSSTALGDPGNWTTTSGGQPAPPGGTNTAVFGSGTWTVTGDGAVGEIVVNGATITMTGQVTAQSANSVDIDESGALTLAGGAVLSAAGQTRVGGSSDGLLTVMGGALATDSLVIADAAGVVGTVVDLEQITATSAVIVGAQGSGALELLGVAASLMDGAAEIGSSSGSFGSATVNGGQWETAGQLNVGDGGSGSLLIDGMASGITGQVMAWDATIGVQSGGQGSVTLVGGEMLVADGGASGTPTSSTLIVGASGSGLLSLANGSEVAVGVALDDDDAFNSVTTPNGTPQIIPNGALYVGLNSGGSGQIDIGGNSDLLVYGSAIVGGGGSGAVTVGLSAGDTALFAVLTSLTIYDTGQVTLGGANATVRASTVVNSGGVIAGAGTLAGLGGGNGTVQLACIENDGVIDANVSGGNLLVYGNITDSSGSGTGHLVVETGASLTLQSTVASNQFLDFRPTATAVLNDPGSFKGTITGFDNSDVLDLASIDATGATWSGGVLTLDTPGAGISIKVAGIYTSSSFAVQSDGHGGTDVILATAGAVVTSAADPPDYAAPAGEIDALHDILAGGSPPLTGRPADGSAFGFVAPGLVTGVSRTVAFSATDAVLLASTLAQGLYAVTLQSNAGCLAVTDVDGIMIGPTSGSTLSLAGTLDQVNTVLASLTDTLSGGHTQDVVFVLAADSLADLIARNVGVVRVSATSSAGSLDIRASTIVISGGVVSAGAGLLAGLDGGQGTVQLASIENDGVIAASGGNLLLYGNVSGTGVLSVDSGAMLTLQAGVGSGQTLEFGPNSLVVLNDAGAFSGTMSGLDGGDKIDIAGIQVSTASWSGGVSSGVLTLGFVPGAGSGLSTSTFQLHLSGAASSAFAVQSDGHGGSEIETIPAVSSGVCSTVSVSQTWFDAQILSGGTLEVSGTAVGTIDRGTVNVWSGGVVSMTPIVGGTLNVHSGGTAVNAIIGRGGSEVVFSGGVDSGATIKSGGMLIVSSSGQATGSSVSATIESGGVEIVSTSGLSIDTTVLDGGEEIVSGAAVGTTIEGGGSAIISGTASNTTVSSGGVEIVTSGTTSNTAVLSGGVEIVLSGGIADATAVANGGLLEVRSGGSATNTVVSSGGTIEQDGSATLAATTFLSGATYAIGLDANVSGFGGARGLTFAVGSGATATATTVSSGAVGAVAGGSDLSASVLGGGTMIVSSGGRTTGDAVVGSGLTLGASEVVSAGGVASATVLSKTGLLTVLSGGEADGTIALNNPLGSGGGLVVSSGGMASGAIVSNGGNETVSAGGHSLATQVKNGATVSVTGGVDSAAVVSNGGTVLLASTGIDSGVTVLNGGEEIVSSGGAASGTILSSGGLQVLSSGGTAGGTEVKHGGVLTVAGGIDSGAVVSSGGQVLVSSGSDVGAVVFSQGSVTVFAGGSTSGSMLLAGALEVLSSGGTARAATVESGGQVTVLSGGTANGTSVTSFGLETVFAGGVTLGAQVSIDGLETVSAGGQALGTVVSFAGSVTVSSGGLAIGAVLLSSGGMTVLKGGMASATTISDGGQEVVSFGGINRQAVVSTGGAEIVSNGGAASGTAVLSGSAEIVSSGGMATSVTLAGGTQTVLKGGSANGTVVSGGVEIVSGSAAGTVIEVGGSAVVSSGGTANAMVLNGGSVTVMSGGAISGATLSAGTLEIKSGSSVLSSTITFAGGGELVLDDTRFRGKIAGFDSPTETIDLTTVSFAGVTLGYTGNALSGTLTVTDGTHTARLAILGNHAAADFTLATDGHGGTLVSDPPVDSNGHLTPSH